MTTIIDRRSNHYSNRNGRRVEYVIVHTTESPSGVSLAATAAYLEQNNRGVSAHELVGPGTVYLMVPDSLAAHHAGAESARLPNGASGQEVNLRTWGIELYNIAGKPVASDVRALGFERIVEACKRLHIPAANVLGHREVDPTRRADPVGIDMNEFRRQVQQALQPTPEPEQPVYSKEDLGRATWFVEQLAREIRDLGDQVAHDIILAYALPAMYKERDR